MDSRLALRFEALRRATGAAVVGLMPVTQAVESVTHFGEGLLVGETARLQAIRRTIVGQPLTESWNPSFPEGMDVNRFVLATQRLKARNSKIGREQITQLYGPAEVEDTMRMLVYDGAICVGWFGCLREQGAPDFSEGDLTRANANSERWALDLAARHRQAQQLLRCSPAHLVTDVKGRIVAHCDEVAQWLTRQRVQRVSEVAADVRRHGASVHAIGRYAFQGVELHSEHGPLVYLNAPLGSFAAVSLAALSPRQLQVASLVALGLTANEAAEELGISAHTVKQHLSAVYRLLGVSRREQLVAVLHSRDFDGERWQLRRAG